MLPHGGGRSGALHVPTCRLSTALFARTTTGEGAAPDTYEAAVPRDAVPVPSAADQVE